MKQLAKNDKPLKKKPLKPLISQMLKNKSTQRDLFIASEIFKSKYIE